MAISLTNINDNVFKTLLYMQTKTAIAASTGVIEAHSTREKKKSDTDIQFFKNPAKNKVFNENYRAVQSLTKQELKKYVSKLNAKLKEKLEFKVFFFDHLFFLQQQIDNLIELLSISNEEKELDQVRRSIANIECQIQFEFDDVEIKTNSQGPTSSTLSNLIGSREYMLLMINGCSSFSRPSALKRIQLRLIYTLLFYTGLRLTVLMHISLKEILEAIETGELKYNDNTESNTESKIFFLEKKGQRALMTLKPSIIELVNTYGLKRVGSSIKDKENAISEKTLMNLISIDMTKCLRTIGNLDQAYSAEDFRRSFKARLLQITNTTIMKQIMDGNYDISNKTKIQDIISKSFDLCP